MKWKISKVTAPKHCNELLEFRRDGYLTKPWNDGVAGVVFSARQRLSCSWKDKYALAKKREMSSGRGQVLRRGKAFR